MRVIIGLPIQIIARGDFVARQVDPSPAGDGQLWFMDFDRCSLEAVGLWGRSKALCYPLRCLPLM